MSMRERIMEGKLFTDYCEGLPEDRTKAKKLMKKFNDLEPAVTIATVGHPINPGMREYMYTDPVKIGDNCWIGANVTICPGVTIGENSVIGAGSVVIKDIPANVVAAGNPCRLIREINEHDKEYYYKDRKITAEDLSEEKSLR